MTLTEEQSLEMPRPRRFTRDEYYRMAELGFFDGKRVELIEGEIVEMAPQKNPHALAVSLVQRALMGAFGEDVWIRTHSPLSLGADSDPEPDVAVVPGKMESYKGQEQNPSTALLVVEVSDTTLRYDRSSKAALYAGVGIREYWILNLRSKCLEVMRDPIADAEQPGRYRYGSMVTLQGSSTVSPMASPAAIITVAELLP